MLTKDSILERIAPLQRIESWQAVAPWVNGLFVLLLAYSLAGVAWRLWPLSEQANYPLLPLPPQDSADHTKASPSNLDAIASLHLFGEVSKVEPVPQVSTIDAPETRLSLTLKGIIALSEGVQGRALIAEGTANEKVFKVGDSLSGGAILHEVLSDKVILKRGGRFETLTLPRETVSITDDEAGGRPLAKTSATSRTQRRGSPQARGGRALVNPASASGGSSQSTSISQQLSSLRQDIVADPQKAFDLIQAQPVMESGAIKGYRVSPGKQRRLFHGTGLRAGDVVTSVNGIALSDPAQMAGLFQQFRTASTFNVVVLRGGRETNLTVNLGQ